MLRRTLDPFGRRNLLANKLGDSLRIQRAFVGANLADWEALYRINLLRVFLCSKAVTPQMPSQGQGGSIIKVSPLNAFRGMPQAATYTACKTAITQCAKSFALEAVRHGIRVNAIAPELINRRSSRRWRQAGVSSCLGRICYDDA